MYGDVDDSLSEVRNDNFCLTRRRDVVSLEIPPPVGPNRHYTFSPVIGFLASFRKEDVDPRINVQSLIYNRVRKRTTMRVRFVLLSRDINLR